MENTALVVARRRPSFKARMKSVVSKTAVAVAGSVVSASAFAQDMPADVGGSAEFMTTKGAIAIAVASAITLIYLGITAAKLPRKGS